MTAYSFALLLHNLLRYGIILIALVAIIQSLNAYFKTLPYENKHNKLAVILIAFVHSQLLLGIILYGFLSPITQAGFADIKSTMADASIRFWVVEHISIMILAVALFQIGKIKIKKAAENQKKHQLTFSFFIPALLLVFLMTPWPFLSSLPYFSNFSRSYFLSPILF